MIHRHVWSSAGSEESYDTTLLNKHFPDAESYNWHAMHSKLKKTYTGWKKELQKVLFNFKFSPRKISFSALPWQLGLLR